LGAVRLESLQKFASVHDAFHNHFNKERHLNRASYRMARALNITPAKAQTLLFQYQLRNISEDDTDHEIMIAITTAKYQKDGDKLSFGVTSPLVKAALIAKMEEKGVFADISLSGNCVPAWKKDPVSGVIGAEEGPLIPMV